MYSVAVIAPNSYNNNNNVGDSNGNDIDNDENETKKKSINRHHRCYDDCAPPKRISIHGKESNEVLSFEKGVMFRSIFHLFPKINNHQIPNEVINEQIKIGNYTFPSISNYLR